MNFVSENCNVCGNCFLICPAGAIKYAEEQAVVDWEQCVECHNCVRAGVCPNDVFELSTPPWPRTLRATFSDPFFKHESTQHLGRGTEEVKTNEVTGVVTAGRVGLAVEAGRPGVAASFGEVEIITKTLARFAVEYPEKTPIRSLIKDLQSGALHPEILGERVLSVIVECRLPVERLDAVLQALRAATAQVKTTVFSVGVFARAGELTAILSSAEGYRISAVAKNNLGLGRRCQGE